MSAQNAKDAAGEFVANLRLPASAKGQKFQLVTFNSEEDCRFFYPRRALDWQRQVNTYISRALRERGIRVRRLTLEPRDFFDQSRVVIHPDEPGVEKAARAFADSHLKFLK